MNNKPTVYSCLKCGFWTTDENAEHEHGLKPSNTPPQPKPDTQTVTATKDNELRFDPPLDLKAGRTYEMKITDVTEPKPDTEPEINSFDDPDYDEPLVRLSEVKRLLAAPKNQDTEPELTHGFFSESGEIDVLVPPKYMKVGPDDFKDMKFNVEVKVEPDEVENQDTQPEGMEDRFDKKFPYLMCGTNPYHVDDPCKGRTLAFIRQELSTSRLELIKELREKFPKPRDTFGGVGFDDGWNQALQEVNEILNSITNEE